MKKKLDEAVFQAITEIDLKGATAEDCLRVAIAAEQGAINLYNRMKRHLEETLDFTPISLLFHDVSEEEKVHAQEFQVMLEKIDVEEEDAREEAEIEVKDVEQEFEDVVEWEQQYEIEIEDEISLVQDDYNYILEKGDRIQILKKEDEK